MVQVKGRACSSYGGRGRGRWTQEELHELAKDQRVRVTQRGRIRRMNDICGNVAASLAGTPTPSGTMVTPSGTMATPSGQVLTTSGGSSSGTTASGVVNGHPALGPVLGRPVPSAPPVSMMDPSSIVNNAVSAANTVANVKASPQQLAEASDVLAETAEMVGNSEAANTAKAAAQQAANNTAVARIQAAQAARSTLTTLGQVLNSFNNANVKTVRSVGRGFATDPLMELRNRQRMIAEKNGMHQNGKFWTVSQMAPNVKSNRLYSLALGPTDADFMIKNARTRGGSWRPMAMSNLSLDLPQLARLKAMIRQAGRS